MGPLENSASDVIDGRRYLILKLSLILVLTPSFVSNFLSLLPLFLLSAYFFQVPTQIWSFTLPHFSFSVNILLELCCVWNVCLAAAPTER